ncbi:MAG: hypothetical protein LBE14_02645 [Treponema sp.]|jgi:hypothetical protein|nr:hypothetical protein [Treponema sp.]
MPDAPLTPDEINQLLTSIHAGDSTGVKHPAVTQEEITQLLTVINAGYSTRLKHTAPLTQDEINWLLAAIDYDNT